MVTTYNPMRERQSPLTQETMAGSSTAQGDRRPSTARQPNDPLLASIHKISALLTRPISLDRILTSIVKETCQVFGFTRMAIFLTDKNLDLLECKYIHGFNSEDSKRAFCYPYRLSDQDCVETRVARLGRTLYIRDYQTDPQLTPIDRTVSAIMGRVSTIAVPLKIKKDIIGLITADKDSIRLRLTRKDINAFTTFVNQASIIIENARLQEQNQQKINQLLTLQEISHQTSSTFHLGKLLQVIATSALKLTRASRARLFLLDEDGRELALAARSEPCALDEHRSPVAVGDRIAAQVAREGQPFLLNSTWRDESRLNRPPDKALSLLAVPLINEKRLLGVLQLDSDRPAAFSGDDQKLLMIYAAHSASLIRNLRLYDQVMTERNFRENILESSPNSMISINLRQEITSLNRRTEEMFRVRRDEVIDRQIGTVFGEEIKRIADLALRDHAVVNRKEIHWRNRDGAEAILEITSSLLRNHQQALIGAMLIVRDMTREKKNETLMHRIDRLTSLGQLSAGVAHEIRNPLASIYFNVQLLAKKLPETTPTRGLINDIQEGVNRIRTLVKGMLDFAKPSLPLLKHNPLAAIVEESMALIDSQLKQNKVEVACTLQEALPDILCDAHQIQQVVVNLLLNAMEAMPKGGRIELKAWFRPGEERQDGQVVLQCRDQGVGIRSDHLPTIFNPFFTTKTDGTGLGLSIVHKILEQHRAQVDVTSEMERGTTFTLSFPVHHATEPPWTTDTPY
ncbi:GAF domain-containing protein [Desulfobulbus propionicus]